MKTVLMLTLAIIFIMPDTSDPKLSDVRKLYYKAAEHKAASVSFSEALSKINESRSPVLHCYKGAALMMEAKYAFNPITKMNRFLKGKAIIESAIKRDPEEPEMRFIRFSIQTNLPFFLGYHEEIEKDKLKLIAAVNKIEDAVLKQNISDYLIASKKCTTEELKKLQN